MCECVCDAYRGGLCGVRVTGKAKVTRSEFSLESMSNTASCRGNPCQRNPCQLSVTSLVPHGCEMSHRSRFPLSPCDLCIRPWAFLASVDGLCSEVYSQLWQQTCLHEWLGICAMCLGSPGLGQEVLCDDSQMGKISC